MTNNSDPYDSEFFQSIWTVFMTQSKGSAEGALDLVFTLIGGLLCVAHDNSDDASACLCHRVDEMLEFIDDGRLEFQPKITLH